jgi:putative hydrolase of the HAD superfamily
LWDFDKNSHQALLDIYAELKLGDRIQSFERFLKKYREINQRYWNLYRQNKVTKEQVRDGRFKDTLAFFNFENVQVIGNKMSELYISTSPFKTNLFPFTHEVLAKLKLKYKLHIITNGFIEVQHIKLRESNLAQYFDVVVCSEETGHKKPHKDVFNLAMQLAKTTPKESVMIGDSYEADVIGGLKAGMKAVWFNPENQYSKKELVQVQCLSELSILFNI